MNSKRLSVFLALSCAVVGATPPGDSRVANWKDNRTGVFLLMFSDSVPSHYQIVVPELVKRNLIATFYVNPGGNKWSNSKDPTPRNQWETVIPKTGMVYGNHSMSHNGIKEPANAGYEIGECTRIILKLAYNDDKPHFVSWNMPGAVPWKITPEETAALLKKYNLIDKPKFDAKHGAVFGVKTIPEMLALADKAIAEKGMEYLIIHGVERRTSEGDPAWSWQDYWALNKDVFRGVIDGIASRKNAGDLWVTDHISQYKYQMERDNKPVFQVQKATDREIRLTMTGTLDHALYDLPLTVMTTVPAMWTSAIVTQGATRSTVPVAKGAITYDALPNGEPIIVTPVATSAPQDVGTHAPTMKRFFNDTSYWNQPLGPNPEIDPESEHLLKFMAKADDRGFWLSLHKWTIPVYEVDRNTPRRKVHRRFRADSPWITQRSAPYLTPDHPLGHGKEFAADAEAGLVPIPDYALQDPESDAHIALVDWEKGWIWEMWAARRRDDGDWESNTGMKYRADGSGVFDRKDFAVHNGESIHPYGPCRAAGVPELAGLIMHDEILAGRIKHKLSFATQAAALQRFVHPPACWTDGGWRDGLPEGAVLQLDPTLDLTPFRLSPGAQVVARALQEYGAVCVDVGGGHPLYAEGLYGDPRKRTWDGLLDGNDLIAIKMSHYRVIKMESVIAEGMGRRAPGTIFGGQNHE